MMSKSNISISYDKSSNALQFKQYVDSDTWKCPAGGAHFWVPIAGDDWECQKCNITREFKSPDYVWNDIMGYARPWSMYRDIDALRQSI